MEEPTSQTTKPASSALARLRDSVPFRLAFSLGGMLGMVGLVAQLASPHARGLLLGAPGKPALAQMGDHWTTGEIRTQCREPGDNVLRLSAMSDDNVQIVITTASIPAGLRSQHRLRIVDAADGPPNAASHDGLVGVATLCEKATGSCHLMEAGEALLGPADATGTRTIRFNVQDRNARAQGAAILHAAGSAPQACAALEAAS